MPRLIDADALAARYMSAPPDYYHTSHIVGEITSAPTVKTQGWISVKDQLPESGKRCLVYATQGFVCHISIASFGRQFHLSGRRANWRVTHWMPLPEPPKEDNGNGNY